MSEFPRAGRQLRSLVRSSGELELSLKEIDVEQPEADEVLVRVEAAPINPSDLGALLARCDVSNATLSGSEDYPVFQAPIEPKNMARLSSRIGRSMSAGNEGAGKVISAGNSDEAQALLGKTVAMIGGSMYSEYRVIKIQQCLLMHEGVSSRDAAACFVNPQTALGMVETMRDEGFSGLVHTAAASNLGQMLQKLCLAEGIPLVNIVRKPLQEKLLREMGATHVCDSSKDSFKKDLIDAVLDAKAYVGFDATGGGQLICDILTAMEQASISEDTEYSRYGSARHKQVYIYGGLDPSPTVLKRTYGMQWDIGGWLLGPFLQKIGSERKSKIRRRVADEIKTTFASNYSKEVSLAGALSVEAITTYSQQSTGQKYLVNPSL